MDDRLDHEACDKASNNSLRFKSNSEIREKSSYKSINTDLINYKNPTQSFESKFVPNSFDNGSRHYVIKLINSLPYNDLHNGAKKYFPAIVIMQFSIHLMRLIYVNFYIKTNIRFINNVYDYKNRLYVVL